jgi:hypothetical protein
LLIAIGAVLLLVVTSQSQGNAATTTTVPGSPTKVSAVAGNAQATVSWTAPGSDGGSPITGYTVTSVPGSITVGASATATSATVTGLTNGTAYRFYVTASNANGTSAPSATSDSVTPSVPTAPSAPVITNVTARDSAVEVSWSPPDTGNSDLTGYVITVYSGTSQVTTVNESASSTDAVVSGLSNGTRYKFTVAAVNSTGTGPPSPESVAVAPQHATAPTTPANLQAFPQDGQIQAGWSAPADGGAAITGYTVSVKPADVGPISVAAGTTVATITGLTDGTAYTVSVTATNASGTSPAATAGPVTPAASIVPDPPQNVSAVSTAAGNVQLRWVPPAFQGTNIITAYTLTASAGGTVDSTVSAPASDCSGSPAVCTATMSGLSSTTAYTFAATATSSAGTGSASPASDSVTPNVVVKKAPVILSSASVSTLRNIATDGTLYFENPPVQVTGLTAGKLVRMAPTSTYPGGFLGKVTSVTTQAGLVAVATSGANLANEYSTLGADIDVPVNAASIQSATPSSPGAAISRPTLRGHLLAQSPAASGAPPISWTNGSLVVTVDKNLLPGTSEQGEDTAVLPAPTAAITGTVTLTPHFSMSLPFPDAKVSISGAVDADLSATLGVHLKSSVTVPIGKFGIADAFVLPGPDGVPIPQDVTFTVSAVLNSNGSVGVSFDDSFTETLGISCTVNVITSSASEDGCTGTHTGSSQNLAKSALYGSMSEQAGIDLGVTWQAAEIAGPQFDLTPWVQATVDTTADQWKSISLGATLGVSIEAADDCWFDICLPGVNLFDLSNLFSKPIVTLWSNGAPFNGMALKPNVTIIPPGGSVNFSLIFPTGQTACSPVSWTVDDPGAGTVDSSGTFTASNTVGTAVVQADCGGNTARAGVVVSKKVVSAPDTPLEDNRGLIDAAVVSWDPPAAGPTPADYTITATSDCAVGCTDADAPVSAVVPYPETYAYIPGLSPQDSYQVTVTAIGSNGVGTARPPITVQPLPALPGAAAGTGALQDAATVAGVPDKTGTAGIRGATVSADGGYVFFLTESRSPLTPNAGYNPDGTGWYMEREPLSGPGTIQIGSVDTSGSIEIVPEGNVLVGGPGSGGSFLSSPDGSKVVFYSSDDNGYAVHDFDTGTSWLVTTETDQDVVDAVANDGTVAFVSPVTQTGYHGSHIYREAKGGSPQQLDSCTPIPDGSSGNDCGTSVSLSADGTMAVYTGPQSSNSQDTIYLYNATTGSNATMFPGVGSNVSLDNPVLSENGTRIVMTYYNGTDGTDGLAIKKVGATTVTDSDVVVSDTARVDSSAAVSDDGGTLVYTNDSGAEQKIKVYQNGATLTAPSLSYTMADSESLTADGSALVYTLALDSNIFPQEAYYDDYPGVYKWQIP